MIDIVKIGGGKDVARHNILDDVARLSLAGRRMVIVHGASEEIYQLEGRLGQPGRYLTSLTGARSRYTDPATLQVVLMACSRVNLDIVVYLQRHGIHAVGLNGIDVGLATARRKSALSAFEDGRARIVRDDYSGKITGIDHTLINQLVAGGFVPVISPPAFDEVDGPVNVDADRLAAAIAVGLAPSRLVLLTNVSGLLRDKSDPSSIMRHVTDDAVEDAMQLADGRMKMKVRAAYQAVSGGAEMAVIADGQAPRPVDAALAGGGTTFTRPTHGRLNHRGGDAQHETH